ncbi:hypothetical protein COB55_02820 [Candidatus Wolfebacteria bacterium]|nr:MAG: hypothetical protein COB55_02820 [Candidatus Wolfebacteria bacterium]
MKKSSNIVVVSVAVGIVLGWMSFPDKNNDSTTDINIGDIKVNLEDLKSIEGLGFEIEGGFVQTSDPDIDTPKLKRKVSGLTENTQIRLDGVVDILKDDHLNVRQWIQIGGIWKIGENFEAAREAWEYALILSPSNQVAPVNLGNLYATDIKDFEKSEEWYLKAIEVSPTNRQAYTKLSELYFYQMKDTVKAIEIIDQGLGVLADDGTLHSFKNALESGGL